MRRQLYTYWAKPTVPQIRLQRASELRILFISTPDECKLQFNNHLKETRDCVCGNSFLWGWFGFDATQQAAHMQSRQQESPSLFLFLTTALSNKKAPSSHLCTHTHPPSLSDLWCRSVLFHLSLAEEADHYQAVLISFSLAQHFLFLLLLHLFIKLSFTPQIFLNPPP